MVLFTDISKRLEDRFTAPFVHSHPWALEYHVGPKDAGFKHEARLPRGGRVIGQTTAKHKLEGIETEIKLHTSGSGTFSLAGKPIPNAPIKAGLIFKQQPSTSTTPNSLELNSGFTVKDVQTHAQYFPVTNTYVVSSVWAPKCTPQVGIGAEVSGPLTATAPSYALAGWAKHTHQDNNYHVTLKTAPCDGDKIGKIVGLAGANISNLNTFIGAKASYAVTSGAYQADIVAETKLNDKANTTIGAKVDEKAKFCAYMSRDISQAVTASIGAKIPSRSKEDSSDGLAWGMKFTVKEASKA